MFTDDMGYLYLGLDFHLFNSSNILFDLVFINASEALNMPLNLDIYSVTRLLPRRIYLMWEYFNQTFWLSCWRVYTNDALIYRFKYSVCCYCCPLGLSNHCCPKIFLIKFYKQPSIIHTQCWFKSIHNQFVRDMEHSSKYVLNESKVIWSLLETCFKSCMDVGYRSVIKVLQKDIIMVGNVIMFPPVLLQVWVWGSTINGTNLQDIWPQMSHQGPFHKVH